jgi:hypothetical protein
VPCGRRSGRNAPLFSPYRRSIAEKADEPRGYPTTSLVGTPVYVAAGGIGTNGRRSPAGGGPRRPSGRRGCGMAAAARKRADLVLSGGGIKGVALVGAVGALIDARYGVQGCLAPRPARSSGR